MRAQALAPELGLDPLYTPFIEAAAELRQKIETQHKQKIEEIKRETAEQTKTLYNKLSEAREEFKRLQDNFNHKNAEFEKITQENITLQQELQITQENILKQQEEIVKQKAMLTSIEQRHNDDIQNVMNKNDLLIDKLKSKIDQINQDYQQQLTHLQQKINYQKQQLTDEVNILREENQQISGELTTFKKEQQTWQQSSNEFIDQIAKLETENSTLQTTLKEKSEKLLRSDHSLKLANEELERGQQYIKELEEKNNSIQKELFENWIHKKEEL
ncbi:MAG: hypothetical protein A3F10_02245 [Coxiella sp. RIFCSPHIGHO2_12_FULL_42_15]|nr:MAG: hypothetical protein A3F10_02245 [Coxiella sp. RIFCSPHIGHO2_12_FULL_42_15]